MCDLGHVTCPVCTSICSPARARAGTVTSLSRSLHPTTLPPPQFGSGHSTPPHPPHGSPASHTFHSRRNGPPLSCLCGGAWQALGSRQGQEVREQSRPFKPPACRERRPAASHHGPRDTEGHLSGGSRFASEPSRSPLPPSQVATLVGGGMWAAPLRAGKPDRRRGVGRKAGEPRGQGAHSEGSGWALLGVQERALDRRGAVGRGAGGGARSPPSLTTRKGPGEQGVPFASDLSFLRFHMGSNDFSGGGVGWMPGRGTKILHDLWTKNRT